MACHGIAASLSPQPRGRDAVKDRRRFGSGAGGGWPMGWCMAAKWLIGCQLSVSKLLLLAVGDRSVASASCVYGRRASMECERLSGSCLEEMA